MSGGKPKRKLRNFLLDWRFQLKYTIAVVVISAIISLVLGFFLYRAQQEAFETSRENSQLLALDDPEMNAAIQAELAKEDAKIKARNAKVLTVLIASLGALVFCLSLLGIIATHKIAGPAYAMRRIMKLIADGTHPHVRELRKGDELREVALELKRMADTLREREERDVAGLEEALKTLQDAGQVPDQVSDWINNTLTEKRKRLGTDS